MPSVIAIIRQLACISVVSALLPVSPVFAVDIFSGLTFPQTPFDESPRPAAPDYSEARFWAALPETEDNADTVPAGMGLEDKQATAKLDVFYIYPTSYLIGGDWNSHADAFLPALITDYGVLPQQAAVFNGVARVYAPRYRQASQGAQMQPLSQSDLDKTLALAFSDVRRAFDYFLDNRNTSRPFLIASHSQGTTHAVPLLQYLFTERPADARRFVAGYLIGNTVVEEDLSPLLPVCETPTETGCYLSWNAVAEGGDGSHWTNKGRPVCVNPLSWRRDNIRIPKSENLGSMPVTGHYFLKTLHTGQTGARCDEGILWIDVPSASGYSLALFPGGGYHAYDYNLFWMNIRVNLEERTQAYFSEAP